MSQVRKAVITAAGYGTRMYPTTVTVQKEMLPMMDRDGVCKPAIQIIVEEALNSGIEDVCLIVNPRNHDQIAAHFAPLPAAELRRLQGMEWATLQYGRIQQIAARLTIVVQEEQLGFGHAVWRAREFVGDEPFLLLLGDHIYTTGGERGCAGQILDVFDEYGATVSAVQQTPAELLHLFGTVCGRRIAERPAVYELDAIYEKPTREYAREHLRQAELLHDVYLCFFGMHVFTPRIFACLQESIDTADRQRGEFQLTTAQERLRASGERCLAFEAVGDRHDFGLPFGYAQTQAVLALNSIYRDQMLAALVRSLAVPQKNVPPAFE